MNPLRLYLSPTSSDLEPYLARVASLVESLGQFTVVMGRVPLHSDADGDSASPQDLATCDLCLLLLAWCYGDVPDDQELSVTHQAYREARRLDHERRQSGLGGLPCLVFLGDEQTDTDPIQFPNATRNPEHQEQLLAFRAEVEQHHVAYFTSSEDMVDKVAAALRQYLRDIGRPTCLPRNLPPRMPEFTGREGELEQLIAALSQGQSVGLSALVPGLEGVGTSTLASEAVHRLAEGMTAFPGGLTWIPCDGRTGVEGLCWVYDQILSAWGLQRRPHAPRRGGSLQTESERSEQLLWDNLHLPGPALVVLDNVETAFPLDQAMERLSPRGFTLLITARHLSAFADLQLMPLDVLDAEAAVHLFTRRYVASGGAWDAARDESDAGTVVQLLGRLPLAIELATARATRAALAGTGVRGLTVELQQPGAIARLQDPLNDAASVRYSVEQSLALLTPDQRVRFASLGLPEGPNWPRPVVEALFRAVPPPEVGLPAGSPSLELERLAALSLVSLVSSDASGGTVERVQMHPLLRALAAEEWGRQPTAVQQAGLEGLVTGVQAWADAHWAVDVAPFALLDADEALLLGALRRAVTEGVALSKVIHTALAWELYGFGGGHRQLGVAVWTTALAAARASGSRRHEEGCLIALGDLHSDLGEDEQARHCYERALPLARTIGNRVAEGRTLTGLGFLARQRGDSEQARHCYEQALAIQRELGDRAAEARALASLGALAYEQGAVERARHRCELALAIDHELGNLAGEVISLGNLGMLLNEQGDYQLARSFYEQALAIQREVGDQRGEASTLGHLGVVALGAGDQEQAAGYLNRALHFARATGRHDMEGVLLIHLAELARVEGRWEDASCLLEEVCALSRSLCNREWEARVFSATARLLRDQGKADAARQAFEQAADIYESIGSTYEVCKVRSELAALDAAQTSTAGDSTPKPKRRWWRW